MAEHNQERYAYSLDTPVPCNLALTTPDGTLLIYDTKLGSVQNRYIPTSHLSASCTCLAWRPLSSTRQRSPTKKSRKRRNSISSSQEDGQTGNDQVFKELAVGTASGSIVLYSTKTAEVLEKDIHSDKVTDVTWNMEGSMIFSCSEDGFVAKLPLKSKKPSKFNIESKNQKFYSIRVHPSQSSLLIGSIAKIFWIDIDTRAILKTFSGHKGNVEVLEILAFNPSLPSYLLSSGNNERDQTVTVWKLDLDSKDNSNQAEVMMSVNDCVSSVCYAKTQVDEKDQAVIGVLSKSGFFSAFDFDPWAKRKKKTIRPSASIKVSTDRDSKGKFEKIPIIASQITSDAQNVQIVHGNHAKPKFELLAVASLEKETCLVRKQELSSSNEPNLGIKILVPETSKSAGTVTPGAATNVQRKRRHSSSSGVKLQDLPMIERLTLLSKETEGISTPPRTDSLLQLLLQGLHNEDRKILNSVLDRADEEVIDKTVRKLPVEAIIPLIVELQSYIRGRGMVNFSHVKWLRSVLQHHAAFLMTNPNCEELIDPIISMCESRTKHYSSLIQLKGKLDIITKQMKTTPIQSMDIANKEALLIHQDDSSDELSDALDEFLLPHSDAEEAAMFDIADFEDLDENPQDSRDKMDTTNGIDEESDYSDDMSDD